MILNCSANVDSKANNVRMFWMKETPAGDFERIDSADGVKRVEVGFYLGFKFPVLKTDQLIMLLNFIFQVLCLLVNH